MRLSLACSVAGLELSGVGVGSEVLSESLDLVHAGAKVWEVLVDLVLELSVVTELSGGEVGGSNQVVGVDTTVEGSASQGIESLDHVLGEGRGELGEGDGDGEGDDVEHLGNEVGRSANDALLPENSGAVAATQGTVLLNVEVEGGVLALTADG